ncbi:MAG: amidohydrolase family protein [Candidatus Bathyarchaeaceae archaeon]
MIVDFHYHVVDRKWYHENWWNGIAQGAVPIAKSLGIEMKPEEIKEEIMIPQYSDPTGEKLLSNMDEAGVDTTVILPLDLGIEIGEPSVSYQEQNKIYADLQKKHPKKIVAFAGVDPRRPDAKDLIRRAIKEWGCKGLKLHPGSGYYPDDRDTYQLIDGIADLKVPILFHSGQLVNPLRSKYCDPIYLDDLLLDFPELTFIAAHLGYGWRESLFRMGETKTNLMADISGWQPTAIRNPNEFCHILRRALDSFGSERILFGTDGPYYQAIMPDKEFIDLIKNLPEEAPDGLKFTREEIDAVLGGNAKRLLGL